jgi:CheY-like chemotaxis protein
MVKATPLGKTVLVVEDDDILCGALRLVLQWEGYQVACAADGQEALDILRTSGPPAFILLDLMLPVLDGWQFREALKADPALAAVPVVVVSALDATRAPQAAGHIQKPFQVEQLLEVIRGQT